MTKKQSATAIIFHGLVYRSLKYTVKSLNENLIRPLRELGEVDLYFHSWKTDSIFNPRAGEKQIELDCTEITRLLPEARGLTELQDVFDASLNWELLFANNPMRACTNSETAAKVTLMNLLRALESQQRAWQYFVTVKDRNYERVIATRADLRFLNKFQLPELSEGGALREGELHVPAFHPSGGVNDRFVLGGEREIEIWSSRKDFAAGWIFSSKRQSTEWNLKSWLEYNNIQVKFLSLLFQRLRADGTIARFDREFKNERLL